MDFQLIFLLCFTVTIVNYASCHSKRPKEKISVQVQPIVHKISPALMDFNFVIPKIDCSDAKNYQLCSGFLNRLENSGTLTKIKKFFDRFEVLNKLLTKAGYFHFAHRFSTIRRNLLLKVHDAGRLVYAIQHGRQPNLLQILSNEAPIVRSVFRCTIKKRHPLMEHLSPASLDSLERCFMRLASSTQPIIIKKSARAFHGFGDTEDVWQLEDDEKVR